jgi:molybdenum cofactor guanylyltransferase
MAIAAVILAGGRSRRFYGAAKGLLSCGEGRSTISRLIEETESAEIGPLVISANELRMYEPFGKPVIADLRPLQGPLGGIEATLSYYAAQIRPQGVLFLPCDLPDISAAEIVRLRDAFCERDSRVVVAETNGRRHHLCAVVRPDILADVQRALDEDRREVKRLWRELGAVGVTFSDARPFFNVNSPADYQQWQSSRP